VHGPSEQGRVGSGFNSPVPVEGSAAHARKVHDMLEKRRTSRGSAPDQSNRNYERQIFFLTSLVGQKVTVRMRNSDKYEGLFHACATEGDQTIILKSAHMLPSDSKKSGEVQETLIIPFREFLEVTAADIPSPNNLDNPVQDELATQGSDVQTTRLEVSSIPQEQRERADRIARELDERSPGREPDDRDEDRSGAGQEGAAAPRAKARPAALPATPPDRVLAGNVSMSGVGILTATDPADQRARRAGNDAEMKRINALNLEPTVPKLEDGMRGGGGGGGHLGLKESQSRNALRQGFQNALEVIQKQQESKSARKNAALLAKSGGGGGSGAGNDAQARNAGQSTGTMLPATGGESSRSGAAGFAFNPRAKEFSPPSGTSAQQGGSASRGNASAPATATNAAIAPSRPAAGPEKPLPGMVSNAEFGKKPLNALLDPFFQQASGTPPGSTAPGWPEARGSSWREVLGQPSAAQSQVIGGVPGNWQQGPGRQMQAPFVMAGAPGGQSQAMVPGGASGQLQMGGFVLAGGQGPGGQQMYVPQFGPGPGSQGPGGNMQQGQPGMGFNQQMMQGGPFMPVNMLNLQGGGRDQAGGGQMMMMPVMMGQMGAGQMGAGQMGTGQMGTGQGGSGGQGHQGQAASQGDGSQGQMSQQQMYHRQQGPG